MFLDCEDVTLETRYTNISDLACCSSSIILHNMSCISKLYGVIFDMCQNGPFPSNTIPSYAKVLLYGDEVDDGALDEIIADSRLPENIIRSESSVIRTLCEELKKLTYNQRKIASAMANDNFTHFVECCGDCDNCRLIEKY